MRSVAQKLLLLAILFFGCLAQAAELPRVMILGDDFFNNTAAEVAKALKGKAVVVRVSLPDELAPTTANALASFDRIVGKEKWDVIYFNFGLAELTYRAPGMKSFRVLPKGAGGVLTVAPSDYEKTLDALVSKLATTGARLIWASTPPITAENRDLWDPGSEVAFNTRAAAVMARHRVSVHDLHAWLTGQLAGSSKDQPSKNKGSSLIALPKTFPFHESMREEIQKQLPTP